MFMMTVKGYPDEQFGPLFCYWLQSIFRINEAAVGIHARNCCVSKIEAIHSSVWMVLN